MTHYGTAGGNPNSIIVDNLVASESVQLPQLVNTVTGILIDRASYYEEPVGEYGFASNLTVRLIPAVDVANNAYGSAAQIGAGATEVMKVADSTQSLKWCHNRRFWKLPIYRSA